MINYKFVKNCCKDDITLIENYYKAINDNSQCYVLHHKLEIHDNYVNRKEEMIMMGLYYNRPACELIFLTKAEHNRIHTKHRKLSDAVLKSKSNAMKAFWKSKEGKKARNRISKKMHDIQLGHVMSQESKDKISKANKGRTAWNKEMRKGN